MEKLGVSSRLSGFQLGSEPLGLGDGVGFLWVLNVWKELARTFQEASQQEQRKARRWEYTGPARVIHRVYVYLQEGPRAAEILCPPPLSLSPRLFSFPGDVGKAEGPQKPKPPRNGAATQQELLTGPLGLQENGTHTGMSIQNPRVRSLIYKVENPKACKGRAARVTGEPLDGSPVSCLEEAGSTPLHPIIAWWSGGSALLVFPFYGKGEARNPVFKR